jgi:heat shock protein beta
MDLLVILSNRLVKSPCAIVADSFGYTANVQKLLSTCSLLLISSLLTAYTGAANAKSTRNGPMHDFALKAKTLEINPRSPLIEGLLRRIEALPTEPEERDEEAEDELKEATTILIDSALVRSGFEVQNSNE